LKRKTGKSFRNEKNGKVYEPEVGKKSRGILEGYKMNKVPEPVKRQILELLKTPKKIQEISEGIDKSKKSAAQYLRILLRQGDVKKIADFEDLRSFFYVKTTKAIRSI
jgi:hypothetical protein